MHRMWAHLTDWWSLLLYFADITYVIFTWHLLKQGVEALSAKLAGGPPPETYPRGYFIWLAISQISIFVTGG